MTVKFLDHSTYLKSASESDHGHWMTFEARWNYHELAVRHAQLVGINDPSEVLELGTMGISIVNGSDSLDYGGTTWAIERNKITYFHDARRTPWPIEDKKVQAFDRTSGVSTFSAFSKGSIFGSKESFRQHHNCSS